MAAAIGSLTFILIAGWLVRRWEKKKKIDLERETTIQPPDENSYS